MAFLHTGKDDTKEPTSDPAAPTDAIHPQVDSENRSITGWGRRTDKADSCAHDEPGDQAVNVPPGKPDVRGSGLLEVG
ncbi:hypothetical protein [Corynebacterium macginleyi]|uniref:hypothetical protein n=1 Tax=Corynebacterium macginleyi TaxID=38290 RepID=UPI000EF9E72A|nr:hypothetical protein [Corynebacterium macginleyi]RMB69636.1 hypothetical protein D9542_02940 [Corynebacterium macginleyi]